MKRGIQEAGSQSRAKPSGIPKTVVESEKRKGGRQHTSKCSDLKMGRFVQDGNIKTRKNRAVAGFRGQQTTKRSPPVKSVDTRQ